MVDLRDEIVDVTDRTPAPAAEHRFVAVVRCQEGFVATCLCGWRATAPGIAAGVDALEAHVSVSREAAPA